MQKYAIEMGGVSRYFSEVSRSGVDLTLLRKETPIFQQFALEEDCTPVGDYCEITSENILACVAERRFSKRIIPKQCFHVILWIAIEYV